MKVKIISCWNKFHWYNDKIGEVVEVVTGEDKHYSCPDDSYQVSGEPLAHIKKSDCEKTDLPTTESLIFKIELMIKDYNMSKINKKEFIENIQNII